MREALFVILGSRRGYWALSRHKVQLVDGQGWRAALSSDVDMIACRGDGKGRGSDLSEECNLYSMYLCLGR